MQYSYIFPRSLMLVGLVASLGSGCVYSHYENDSVDVGGVSGYARDSGHVEIRARNRNTGTFDLLWTVPTETSVTHWYQADDLYRWHSGPLNSLGSTYVDPSGYATLRFVEDDGDPIFIYRRNESELPDAASPAGCIATIAGHSDFDYDSPDDWSFFGGAFRISNPNMYLDCGGTAVQQIRLRVQ